MSLTTIATSLAWGLACGYLSSRILDSLLGMGFCLHALLTWRWKRLAGKVATGMVKPESSFSLLLKLTLWALFFTALLRFGDDFARYDLRFEYSGSSGLLFFLAAAALVLGRLPATRRRLVHYWRLSHQVDYAERRRRTQLLR
ncbi:hypothetical protein [Trichloromonas sp.]|uniref:hypothetical protein n=1 Tax=Trichloromonas sp. TaxID=3069249 RepID=UPI003D81A676